MAIFRGGVKIFGSDVRLGIPRDRSLDNVMRDPRFLDPEGGQDPNNPFLKSTQAALINQMLAYIQQGEGLGRTGRYYASFQLPGKQIGTPGSSTEKNRVTLKGIDVNAGEITQSDVDETFGFATPSVTSQIQNSYGKRVNAFCRGITMPDRTMTTVEIATGPGPKRHFVTDHTYGDLTATFYADKYLRERQYFELWQKSAFNSLTNNYELYDNYVSDIDLFNLGQFANSAGSSEDPAARDDVTHGVKLYDCYPTTIGAPALNYDNNNIIEFTVTFKYRYWQNYFITKTADVAFADDGFGESIASEGPQRLKHGGGLIGGLIGMLPSELRRPARDVLQDLKRRIPIGDLTGGRVFPPFF